MSEQIQCVDDNPHCNRHIELECLVADDAQVGTLCGKIACDILDDFVFSHQYGYLVEWHPVGCQTVDISLYGSHHILVLAILWQHFHNHLTIAFVLFLVFLFHVGVCGLQLL